MKLIAHRGIHNKNVIENSYDAIKMALDSDKYVGVEFDIRITKDKEFILYHDNTYNGKLIKNTLYKELPKYVPKLVDILNINSNKIFLIEIKNILEYQNKLIKILNRYKNKNIYVMSFSKNILKLDRENRKYKLGILNYVLNTDISLKKLDFICILNSLINKRVIDELKEYEIFSYGIIKKKEYDSVYYIVDD